MKIYIKHKKDFEKITDYSNIKIGQIVKLYSEKTGDFINKKAPYFVSSINDNTITLESGSKRLNFNITSENLTV